MIKGFQLVAMLTSFWRDHKQDVGRPVVFVVPAGNQTITCTAVRVQRGREATEVILRRIDT